VSDFLEEVRGAINRACVENDSNTPDYILAQYMEDCLKAYEKACKERERWYGYFMRPAMPIVIYQVKKP